MIIIHLYLSCQLQRWYRSHFTLDTVEPSRPSQKLISAHTHTRNPSYCCASEVTPSLLNALIVPVTYLLDTNYLAHSRTETEATLVMCAGPLAIPLATSMHFQCKTCTVTSTSPIDPFNSARSRHAVFHRDNISTGDRDRMAIHASVIAHFVHELHKSWWQPFITK